MATDQAPIVHVFYSVCEQQKYSLKHLLIQKITYSGLVLSFCSIMTSLHSLQFAADNAQ